MIRIKITQKLADEHFKSIQKKITTRLKNVKKDGYVVNKIPNLPDLNTVSFLDFLLADTALENLITALPQNLQGLSALLFKRFPDLHDTTSILFKTCKRIFVNNAYESYLDKWKVINSIGLDVCPYCNRAYTTTLERSGKIKPQIDHFYPTSIFPFFAVSYFNLIPSCAGCNGLEMKSQKNPTKFDLVSPYLLLDDDFLFSYEPVTGRFPTSPLDKNVLKVILKRSKPGNNAVFKLEKLYQTHSDHVAELIFKHKVKYGEKFREELRRYPELNLTDKEINRLILGNYGAIEDFSRRPLAKLYYDIGIELGLIFKE